MKRPKRHLVEDPNQIPSTLFPSLCCLFAAIALGIACAVAGSREWFRDAARIFYPSLPTPELRYAPAPEPGLSTAEVAELRQRGFSDWAIGVRQEQALAYRKQEPTPLPRTSEEEAQIAAAHAQYKKADYLSGVFIWTGISLTGLTLLAGYVLNAIAWRKFKGRCVTEGVAFLTLMWFNIICLALLGTLFGTMAMGRQSSFSSSSSSGSLVPILFMLVLAGFSGYLYYNRLTKLPEDRMVLSWPKMWNRKLAVVCLLPILPLMLLLVP